MSSSFQSEILVTNILPKGTAFGVLSADPTQKVFIPAHLSRGAALAPAARRLALLVPNSMQPDNTPWMVAQIFDHTLQGAEFDELVTRVHDHLMKGGVWTVTTLHSTLFPHGIGGSDQAAAIADVLRTLFQRGAVARFQLWRAADPVGRPAREWYTCYPERADVDEWETADA